MSGRSAYVRKKVRKLDATSDLQHLDAFPMPAGHDLPFQSTSIGRRGTGQSGGSVHSDELAYARAKAPAVPDFTVVGSGIMKSARREKIDNMSENVRRGISGLSFGTKKKKTAAPKSDSSQASKESLAMAVEAATDEEAAVNNDSTMNRPESATSTVASTNTFGVQGDLSRPNMYPPPLSTRPRKMSLGSSVTDSMSTTSAPPVGELPPIPPQPQLKRWAGCGRPPSLWNKLQKDPELWDPVGDTLIFLTHRGSKKAHSPPSFRISSRVLESTESRFFLAILREGCVDGGQANQMRASGASSPTSAHDLNLRREQASYRMPLTGLPTPPQSVSNSSSYDPDGTISYELFFPAPLNVAKTESLRYHATTRNILALLYQVSLVGTNMCQALTDLTERLQMYMPGSDCAALVINYITAKGLDDVQNDPTAAVSLLAWSESKQVRWWDGWREAFVHIVGMQDRAETVPEWRAISPVSRALVERASLESQVRMQGVEDRLAGFNFSDVWPITSETTPPERGCFDRLRLLFIGFYQHERGSWPPARDQGGPWLTRDVVQTLQTDFGALYDYLVDREAEWDCNKSSSTGMRKIVKASPDFTADTATLPMNDILIAFDSQNQYPHIPHPYPLVPASISPPTRDFQNQSLGKASNNVAQPQTAVAQEKLAERKASLAYSEATNIYILSDFTSNKLVEAFVRFEKIDRVGALDPYAARRGRWVLIYAILQTLACVSVDASGLRWKDNVRYHLNAKLKGTPPWRHGAQVASDTSDHERSYCWLAPHKWSGDSEDEMPPSFANTSPDRTVRTFNRNRCDSFGMSPTSRRTSLATSISNTSGTDTFGSHKTFKIARRYHSSAIKEVDAEQIEVNGEYNYGPGIERIGTPSESEWPMGDEDEEEQEVTKALASDGGNSRIDMELEIRDFDDFQYEQP